MGKLKSQRELQFENEHVAVWKAIVQPNEPIEMHSYDAGRVVVSLKGGILHQVDKSGDGPELKLDTHQAYWVSADEYKREHGDFNSGPDPVEVMIIEMKSAKKRPLPSRPID